MRNMDIYGIGLEESERILEMLVPITWVSTITIVLVVVGLVAISINGGN